MKERQLGEPILNIPVAGRRLFRFMTTTAVILATSFLPPSPAFAQEPSEFEIQTQRQTEADYNWAQMQEEVFRKYPWYLDLPLQERNYFVFFESSKNSFNAEIYPQKSSSTSIDDQVVSYQEKISEELRRLNVDTSVHPIEWVITPERSALITVDGLGSSSDSTTFDGILKRIPHDERVRFSYSDSDSYEPEHTFQDISKMAEKLKDKVEQLKKQGFRQIDLLGYSLGSVVIWEYLINNVIPWEGIHRDRIRAVELLAGPIHGVPEAKLSYALSYMFGDNFLLGNEATNMLALWGSSDARRLQNEKYAETLRERRTSVTIATNENDCFTPPVFVVLPNISQIFSMGRGERGIPNCDSMLMAPLLGGNTAENLGHTQVLTDPRVLSQSEYFFVRNQS